ncbi:caspase family protein [Sorangium sp. So ce117]|uniref:caspase family protein n=1 Tax=Sorangium sp. So ce117 TaxID=3133277 RepID=UPI003F63BCA1
MPATEPTPPRRHVLLIGIDAYPGPSALRGCVNDIDAIEAILLERLAVPPSAITKLAAPCCASGRTSRLPEQAPTSANLRAAFEALAGEAVQPGDRVLIYYAGHGTQVLPRNARTVREALVPVDIHAGGALLYDYELNALLHRISRRTGDVTVVLDCCCSAGVTRSASGTAERAVRFYPLDNPTPPPLLDLPGRRVAEPPAGLVPALDAGDPGHVVIAACQSDQVANEGSDERGVQHGAFTAALLRLLAACHDSQLDALRWAELWHALRQRISHGFPGQSPWLVGRAERRVFGGAFDLQDPGVAVSRIDAKYRLEAGTMVGFTRGARVAVYGRTPSIFPPLGSSEDLGARLGVLDVEEATPWSCTAVPVGAGDLLLVDGARGRLIAPGKGDALVVQLEPYDAHLAHWLEREGPLRVVRAPASAGEASLAEVFVEASRGRYIVSDALVYPAAGGEGAPLLFSVPGHDRSTLVRGLLHYAQYNLALRLSRRCRDLPGALRVRVLDCRDPSALGAADLQDPPLPEVRPDPERRYRYAVEHDQPVCVVVENRSSTRLYANLLNCAASGRVEILGTSQHELAPGRCQTFWLRGQLGQAFRCRLPEGRQIGVDRLVAIATTRPDADLSFLRLDRSFEDAVCTNTRDMGSDDHEPREMWTATLVAMKLVRASSVAS